MSEDGQLLRSYAEQGSEAAFRELVARHMDLVYSTALRRTDGDTGLAQDVAQQVFTDLARNAGRVSRRFVLGGWLYRHACFLAAKMLRSERRRQARERTAVAMNPQDQPTGEEGLWQQVAPVLDTAMLQLSPADRDALVLRFLQNQDLRQVGAVIGVSEDTAQKRVSRALEKLRKLLVKQGVTSSAAALAATLAGYTVSAAPVGLASSVAGGSLAGTAAATGSLALALNFMAITKVKIAVGAALVGLGTTAVLEHQSWLALRRQNDALRAQVDLLTRQAQERQPFSHPEAMFFMPRSVEEQREELASLRGAVGALRQQTNDLAALRTENRRLRAANPAQATPPEAEPDDPADAEFKKETLNRVNDFRQWGLLFITHALKSNNQFPDSWEQVAEQVSPEARASFLSFATNNYEIVYRGETAANGITSNSPAKPGETLLFREKQARRSPQGEWVKVYGYVDGSTEAHTEPTDDFTVWETQHLAPAR